MATIRVPLGALDPYALTYRVTSKRFDLTSVTAGYFAFRRSRGAGVAGKWTATLKNKQARSVEVYYAFQAGDLPDVDTIVFEPVLTSSVGPGKLVAAQRSLEVFLSPGLVLP